MEAVSDAVYLYCHRLFGEQAIFQLFLTMVTEYFDIQLKPVDRIMTKTTDWDFVCQPEMGLDNDSWSFFSLERRRVCLYARIESGEGPEEVKRRLYALNRVVTFAPGICPKLDECVHLWKTRQPGVVFEYFSDPFKLLNRCVTERLPFFIPDFGVELHPQIRRIPLEGFPEIPYGLRYPNNRREITEPFLELLAQSEAGF